MFAESGRSAPVSRSLDEAVADREREIQQQDKKVRDELVKLPRCAIIPSPDKLNRSSTKPGLDEIATRTDFNIVWQWLTSSKFLNTGFYDADVKETVDKRQQLETDSFKTLVNLAFGNAFDAIRNTCHPDDEEMVLLYYSGHGLPRNHTLVGRSSFPALEKLNFTYSKQDELLHARNLQPLNDLNPSQQLKGGELLLHDVGFCDLQALLTPWVAAVTEKSNNAPGRVKEKKHLVVIADSCFSGVLAQDLQRLMQREGPWNKNGCSVTVQSACSNDEPTFGGYFTPCFVHFNKKENWQDLENLKKEWDNLSDKQEYQDSNLPSPQVKTTRQEGSAPTMELHIQGFRLTLFRDPAFFKFCYVSYFTSAIINNPPRGLTEGTAQQFLEQEELDVIDYKLKTIANGTPMALVLLDSEDENYLVCAHIHFKDTSSTNFSNSSGFRLVHHKQQNNPCLISPQEDPKIRILRRCAKTRRLFEACKRYVKEKEPGRWEDVARWNMRNSELGVNGKFKSRSAWMDNYLEEINR